MYRLMTYGKYCPYIVHMQRELLASRGSVPVPHCRKELGGDE